MKRVVLLLASSYLVTCLPPPHPAVVALRQEEDQLPEYLRSPALHNPHLRHILPLSSLLHEGEKVVHHREADDVSRREIYNILTHAGFISRRRYQHHFSTPTQFPRYGINHQDFFEPSAFTNPELLQHL